MNWETYLALGDSITIGARTYLGYPEIAGHMLSQQLNRHWNVINHATCGFTAIDLARNIDLHFLSLKEQRPNMISILIGTNDIKERINATDYEVAMNQVLTKACLLADNSAVTILGIPEFHIGISYPYAYDMNAQIAVFNSILCELADKYHTRFLQLTHTAAQFTDGVHLNQSGIKSFAGQLVAHILSDKGISAPMTPAHEVQYG